MNLRCIAQTCYLLQTVEQDSVFTYCSNSNLLMAIKPMTVKNRDFFTRNHFAISGADQVRISNVPDLVVQRIV